MSTNEYAEATTEEEIDEVTRVKIGSYFESIDEEFKIHREAILAIATLVWGKQSNRMTIEKAKEKVQELLKVNEEVEKIIERGKQIKIKRGIGWQKQ